jgi:phage portal protein BeeE
MSQRALSGTEFQDYGVKDTAFHTEVGRSPLSSSANTLGTGNAQTAWRTKDLGGGRPLPWSSKTGGSTYKFDDGASPSFEVK